jgi:hypothetical protein
MGQASLDDIVSNQGPATPPVASAASAATTGGTAHIDDIVSNQGPATPAPGTTGVGRFVNQIGEGGAEAAKDIYGVAKGMVPGGTAETGALKTVWNNLPPVQLADSVKQTLPLFHAYEQARSKGASISDALTAVNEAAKQHSSNISQITPIVEAFKANPTRETARALLDTTAAAASLLVGGEAAPPEAEAAATVAKTPTVVAPTTEGIFTRLTNPFRKAAPSDPGFIERAIQGEKVAQAPAQAATRAAVKVGGGEVGLSTVQPVGLRTLAEEPISIVNGLKKGVYSQVDQAAGTDLKTLYDKLDAINDKIDLEASGSPAEAKLEEARTSQMQTIEDAKTQARAKGVDVDKMLAKGDALHTREMALRDLQKGVLKNVNVVPGNAAAGTPETINVDSAVKAVQKLQDNTRYGAPRLEQALGKEGAKNFLNDLYAAQRSGVRAMQTQNFAKIIGKYVLPEAVGGAVATTYALSR